MTHWNRLDIKNATGGKTNKCTRFLFALSNKFGSLGIHNTMHNNRLKPVSSEMVWHEIQSIVTCIVLCAPRVPIFFQSAKINFVLLFGFPPVAFLISNRFQCVIYQMKENKFVIKFMIYYLWVGVMPFELWSNELTVQLLILHTVDVIWRVYDSNAILKGFL